MLTAVTEADSTALTTLADVKVELGLKTGAEDNYLNAKILQATDEILDYLKVKRCSDATRTIAQQDLLETFLTDRHGRFRTGRHAHSMEGRSSIVLARRPVTAVSQVIEGTTLLDVSQYEFTESGVVFRLSGGQKINWANCNLSFAYTAGWIMPPDSDRNLPYSISGAAIEYIKQLRLSRRRDSRVKSENVVGIAEREFWVGAVGDEGSLPPNVCAMLDRYRHLSFGE